MRAQVFIKKVFHCVRIMGECYIWLRIDTLSMRNFLDWIMFDSTIICITEWMLQMRVEHKINTWCAVLMCFMLRCSGVPNSNWIKFTWFTHSLTDLNLISLKWKSLKKLVKVSIAYKLYILITISFSLNHIHLF